MASYKYIRHTAAEIDEAIEQEREHCANEASHTCQEDKDRWNGAAELAEENKSDILINSATIERIGLKAGSSAAGVLSAAGWYRVFIAERKQTVRSGILMFNRAFNAAAPESYTILFNLTHSKNIFRLLSKNAEGQGITKIRLAYSSSASRQLMPCYIDIYYNSTSGNTMTASVYCESIAATGAGSTFANSRFVVSDFSVAEIPEGYTSFEFDLTGKDMFERLTALETALSQTTTVSE